MSEYKDYVDGNSLENMASFLDFNASLGFEWTAPDINVTLGDDDKWLMFGDCAYEHTLVMQDSYGDGWNGASITISEQNEVLLTSTITTGSYGQVTAYLCPDTRYYIEVNSGSYYYEVSWELYRGTTLIISGGAPTSCVL